MSAVMLSKQGSKRHASRQEAEVSRVARRSVRESARVAAGIRTAAVKNFRSRRAGTGDGPGMGIGIRSKVLALGKKLRDTMVAAHLMGQRRSVVDSKRLSLAAGSLYDEVLKLVKDKVDFDLDDLEHMYDTTALRILDGVSNEVEASLQAVINGLHREGAHLGEALNALSEEFDRLGISPASDWQLETIFRTQSALAYGAGRWLQDQDEATQEILWGYQYVTVGDDRVREDHAELDGVTLEKDDPFWDEAWPPCGWNCRCQVIPLFSKEDEVRPPRGWMKLIDDDFQFNPGQVFGRGLGLEFEESDRERDEHGRWTSGGPSSGGDKAQEAIQFVNKFIMSSKLTPSSLTPEARSLLHRTVDDNSVMAYRGVSIVKSRVTTDEMRELLALKVGDPAPSWLSGRRLDLTDKRAFSSFTKKEKLAAHYAREGDVEVILSGVIEPDQVVADLSNLGRLDDAFDNDTKKYGKLDKEIIVEGSPRLIVHSIRVKNKKLSLEFDESDELDEDLSLEFEESDRERDDHGRWINTESSNQRIAQVSFKDIVDDVAVRVGLQTIAEYDPTLLDGLMSIQGGRLPSSIKANAVVDTENGRIWLPDGKAPNELSTLVHELTHLRQKAQGKIPEGGREVMTPDTYNDIEIEAHQAAKKFKEWHLRLEFEEEEHPRDDSGKFTSGGGSQVSSSTKVLPQNKTYAEHVKAAKEWFAEDSGHAIYNDAAMAKELKRNVMQKIGLELKDVAGLKAFAAEHVSGRWDEESGKPVEQRVAARLTDAWAESSGDSHMLSVAMQMRAKALLSSDAIDVPTATVEGTVKGAEDIIKEHGDVIDAYVRAVYDHTQAEFKLAGIERVTVFRGMHSTTINDSEPFDGEAELELQPLSSFSTDYEVAHSFARGRSGRLLIAMDVPVEKIFSAPLTGPGCMTEEEVVILGGRYKARAQFQPGFGELPESEEEFFS